MEIIGIVFTIIGLIIAMFLDNTFQNSHRERIIDWFLDGETGHVKGRACPCNPKFEMNMYVHKNNK